MSQKHWSKIINSIQVFPKEDITLIAAHIHIPNQQISTTYMYSVLQSDKNIGPKRDTEVASTQQSGEPLGMRQT